MDGYEHLDLDEVDFAPVEAIVERLALLTLEEGRDLLRLLQAVAAEDGALSPQADRMAREIAALIPSQN